MCLIRDAAYRSLPKNARADLHERFAAWLERTAEDRLREFEEIVGYHLEQAFRYRVVLGARNSRADALAALASERLEAAGRRALVRSDLPAAIGLLERVSRLLATDDPRRTALLAEIGAALIRCGRLTEAGQVLDEAERLAAAATDERAASHVLVQQQFLRLLHVEEGGTEEAARAAARVMPIFERAGDDLGLCRARRLEAWLHWNEARAEAAAAIVGARGRTRADGRGSPRIRRDPDLDRVLALVRPDPGRGRHPPLRGDARGGAREPRGRGRHPAPSRRPARDGRPLPDCAAVARDQQHGLRRARPHAQRGDRAERGLRRAARRQPGCGRGEPARRVPGARGDGRARVPLDHRRPARADAARAGARKRGRGVGGAQR